MQNRRFAQSPIDALIDLVIGGPVVLPGPSPARSLHPRRSVLHHSHPTAVARVPGICAVALSRPRCVPESS